jgi:hypothetical protein
VLIINPSLIQFSNQTFTKITFNILKMKKLIFLISILIICTINLNAQPMPPGDAGEDTGPVGGGAPIENGVWVLMSLGAIYACTRIYFKYYYDTVSEQEEM